MPETFNSSLPQQAKSKKRGKLLVLWLAVMLVANVGTALTYLLWNSFIAATYPNAPSWIWYMYGLIGIANVMLTIFLFMWKKWAFFAFCGTATLVFVLNLMVGLGIVSSVFGLVGPVILYLLIRPKWNLFE